MFYRVISIALSAGMYVLAGVICARVQVADSMNDAGSFIWRRIVLPAWPVIERLGLTRGSVRQPFVVGSLRSSVTLAQVKHALAARGFEGNPYSMIDPGELVNFRKLDQIYDPDGVLRQSPKWQWHVRVFSGREVRGHYERTPESAPISHKLGIGMIEDSASIRHFIGEAYFE
jgi:hypothetical protein